MLLTTVLAVAALFSTVKAPVHAAPDAPTVTWEPGKVSWAVQSDGRCLTSQGVVVTAGSEAEAEALATALRALPRLTDFPADSGILDAHANVGATGGGTTTVPVQVHSYIAADTCQAPTDTQRQALLHTSDGRLDTVQLSAVPTEDKTLVGAAVMAATYIAVSTAVMAGLAAAGVGVAVSTAAQALAGCVGGAVSAAVASQLLTGWPDRTKARLASVAGGCITGDASGVLTPTAELGDKIGNALRGIFPAASSAAAPGITETAAAALVIGDSALEAAEAAGIKMIVVAREVNAGITTAVNAARAVQ